MNLYIDTSNSEKILIKLDGTNYETDSKREKAQALLPFIAEKLSESGKEISDISDIDVHTGPGSFTGIRVGVSVANAISYALGLGKHFNQLNY
jgi:tRNA threonylcarbamoyladenosine biosynthesis protein TsaB